VEDMIEVMEFLKKHHMVVEQCQIFTPTPGTASTVMYATGLDPATLKPVHVEKREHWKQVQKALILYHLPESRRYIAEALTKGRPGAAHSAWRMAQRAESGERRAVR